MPPAAAVARRIDPTPEVQSGWTALVLAGERPGGDPLARELGVPMKALIPIHGKTLLDHVLQSLLKVDRISRIVVLSQDIETLASADPLCAKGNDKITFARSGNGISLSIEAIAGTAQAPWPVLVTTADNALLTPERVERFIDGAGESDISFGVGKREIVERRFPGVARTWLKFSDGHYSGANLFAFTSSRCAGVLRFWSMIERDRKKSYKIFSSFGPLLLLRAMTRSISFPAAVARAAERLGCSAQPVELDAEAPVDVDKLSDYALVESVLASRKPL